MESSCCRHVARNPSTGDDDASTNAIVVSDGMGGGVDLFAAISAATALEGSSSMEMDMDVAGETVHATGAIVYGASPDDVDMTTTFQPPAEGGVPRGSGYGRAAVRGAHLLALGR